jgi:meiotically up-regulated gene 157 (Mug157) protein
MQTARGVPSPGGSSLAPADRRSLVDGLLVLLADRGVPPHRLALACRAVDLLLRSATTRRGDGAVYVVTGDIPAMWLRDSAAQVRPLLALAPALPAAADLATGVLRAQVEQVLIDPRANAFNPGPTGAAVRRDFHDQSPWVFERKYAVDSLCAPLALAWELWRATGSVEHVDARFREAARTIVTLWRREQVHDPGSFVLRRRFARRADSLSHRGRGAPVARTGMTWSGFRPSDDACVYGYHVPANAFAAVSLERLDALLEAAEEDEPLRRVSRLLAAEIRDGIARHGVVDSSAGPIYAYEVDGLGNALLLDDANVPSLLSLPYLGFCAPDDPLYLATRSWALGPDNPCWAESDVVRGVGSTHARRGWVWPLSIAMEGLTALEEDEREEALCRLEATVTGDLLFHESVDPADPRRFTRRWFSWADMLYVELVLATAGVLPD